MTRSSNAGTATTLSLLLLYSCGEPLSRVEYERASLGGDPSASNRFAGSDFEPTFDAPTCSDSTQNGNEAGIDCGGPCPRCCETASDCPSGVCGACAEPPCPCEPPTCGDGMQNGDEECDGEAGASCADLGYTGGALGCTGTCTFDTSGCTQCGDGTREGEELCDGDTAVRCEDLGYDGGTLTCSDQCDFDTSSCWRCGDGLRDPGEECDPGSDTLAADFGDDPVTCEDQGFSGGDIVGCRFHCYVDTSACTYCGDGIKNADEECDGNDVGELTCTSLGHQGGALGCNEACEIVTSACHQCGDGELDDEEACDPGGSEAVFRDPDTSCTAYGFYEGTDVACHDNCTVDTSPCSGFCGDGIINGPEACDGSELNGETCESLGLDPDRTLGCTDACEFDRASCGECSVTCGDCDAALACIDGTCQDCTQDTDCCPPLICFVGKCMTP